MLIGLAGFKRAGKDTLGDALVRHHGFAKFAFADALRVEVDVLFGVEPCRDDAKDAHGHDGASYRDILLKHGHARRMEDPNYWIKVLDRRVAGANPKHTVVTDCRMPGEFSWVRSNGGMMVWIERDGAVSNGDVTERNWKAACDFVIRNDLGSARDMADGLMARIAAEGLFSVRAGLVGYRRTSAA